MVENRYFEHTYVGHHLHQLDTPQGSWLLLVTRHATYFPTQVVLLEPLTGVVVSEYWHPGHVSAVEVADLDRDGHEELLLGVINNPGYGFGHAGLAVLDLPFAPHRTGAQHYFGDENAKERLYVLFPRADVFDTPPVLMEVSRIRAQGPDRIQIAVGNGEIILHYYLDSAFRVTLLKPSDNFVSEHERRFQAGLLDHPFHPDEQLPLRWVLPLPTAEDGNGESVQGRIRAQDDR